jgi:hypothetical protein
VFSNEQVLAQIEGLLLVNIERPQAVPA